MSAADRQYTACHTLLLHMPPGRESEGKPLSIITALMCMHAGNAVVHARTVCVHVGLAVVHARMVFMQSGRVVVEESSMTEVCLSCHHTDDLGGLLPGLLQEVVHRVCIVMLQGCTNS